MSWRYGRPRKRRNCQQREEPEQPPVLAYCSQTQPDVRDDGSLAAVARRSGIERPDGPDHGQIAQSVEDEGPAGSGGGDQEAGEGRADDGSRVPGSRVQPHGRSDALVPDESRNHRLASRIVERHHRGRSERDDEDVPGPNEQDASPVDPIGDGTADQRDGQRGHRTQQAIEAEVGR